MNFYISDLHIGHENVIRFDNRPFANADEMNDTIFSNWNSSVTRGDTVYILGDFIWLKESKWYDIVSGLTGNKVLVRGNHDPRQYSSNVKNLFQDITNIKEIVDEGRHVLMCHYPIPFFRTDFSETSYMLYGHVHTTKEYDYVKGLRKTLAANRDVHGTPLTNFINVGAMMPYMNYTPRTLDEIIAGDEGYRKSDEY